MLTLGLGIGAAVSMFSVVNAVLLAPLPYKDVSRLTIISERDVKHNQVQPYSLSYLNYLDWAAAQHSFSELALFRATTSFKIIGTDRMMGSFRMVSWNFLPMLGVRPMLGRSFTADDDRTGGTPTVILSYSGWLKLNGPFRMNSSGKSDSEAFMGEKLFFNGQTYNVIGILPREFTFYIADVNTNPDGYIPIGLETDQWKSPRARRPGISALGLLKPGITSAAAFADLDTTARRLEQMYPDDNKNRGAAVSTVLDTIVSEDLRKTLWFLTVAVALVLLIACANVTNLLLSRATTRQKEIAIRFALGGRWQVVRQVLVESMLLAFAGGLSGVVIAIIGIDLLVVSAPVGLPRIANVGLDWKVMVFSFSLSTASGFAFAVVPVMQVLRTNFLTEMKEGGTSASTSRHTAQNVIIVGELALAIILLIGAGLVWRSTEKALNGNPGFDPANLWSFAVFISPPQYATSSARRNLFKDLETRFAALGKDIRDAAVVIGGLPKPISVDSKYLRLMGVRLLKGRFFDDHDGQHAPPVIVIDETLARARFRDEEPIGKPFSIDLPGVKDLKLDRPREVIGVVSHIQRLGIETDDETVIQSQFYLPTDQLPDELVENVGPRILLKGVLADNKAQGRMESAIHAIDPTLEISKVVKMQDAVESAVQPRRYVSKLFAIFALIAFVLAGMGVFGLMNYSVAQRTPEIGIRMSLGAQPGHVVGMILRHAGLLSATGIALGLLASLWLRHFVEYLLFDITATDPATYAFAVVMLFGVALFAAYLPASRAARLEPSFALRGNINVKSANPVQEIRAMKGHSFREACIEVVNLHKTYGTASALAGVTFEIHPGTIFGLIGQNGAGKTTLVKILMGLARPTAGSARLLGCSPGDPIAKRRIGYLPEQMRIPDHFAAQGFMRYMGRLNAVDAATLDSRIPILLEKVGLGGVDKPIRSFSKGMQQRLGLAQALLNDPEVLFLDEPTDGLDPLGRVFVRDLLVQLRDAGKTVFLNSHLLSEIELVCDRIVILDKGVVACSTTPAEVASGAGEYRIRVEAPNAPMLEQTIRALQPLTGKAELRDNALRFKPTDTPHLNAVLDGLRQRDVLIVAVEPVKLSLEEFFIRIVEKKES